MLSSCQNSRKEVYNVDAKGIVNYSYISLLRSGSYNTQLLISPCRLSTASIGFGLGMEASCSMLSPLSLPPSFPLILVISKGEEL